MMTTVKIAILCSMFHSPDLTHYKMPQERIPIHKQFKVTVFMFEKINRMEIEPENIPSLVKYNVRVSYYVVGDKVKVHVGELVPQLNTGVPSLYYVGTKVYFLRFLPQGHRRIF